MAKSSPAQNDGAGDWYVGYRPTKSSNASTSPIGLLGKRSDTNHVESTALSQTNRRKILDTMLWWWPELFATAVSIVAMLAIAFVALHYRGQGVVTVSLPSRLTLNSLIALLATVARACLLVPVASTLSQEVWLALSEVGSTKTRLRDLNASEYASRGTWGSILLLGHIRRRL